MGEFFVEPKAKPTTQRTPARCPSDFLVGYAPGQPPEILQPGQAKLIKAGSDLVLEVHYTTNGKPSMDRSKFGIVFAKEPPRQRVLTLSATNGTFHIPPGDPNYRVDAEFEIRTPVMLASLHPHMHGRGQGLLYRVVYPTGETQTLLACPRYNWHWQLWYILDRAAAAAEGDQDRVYGPLRQFRSNPDNRGSHQGSSLGRSELGRDDGGVLQSGVRCQSAGREILPPRVAATGAN